MPPKRKPEKRKDASRLVGGPGVTDRRTSQKGKLQEPKVVRAKWRETLIASHVDPMTLIMSPKRCQGIVASIAGDVGIRPCLEPREDGSAFCAVCGRSPERQARMRLLLKDGWEILLMADLKVRERMKPGTKKTMDRKKRTYKDLTAVKRPEKRGKRAARKLEAEAPKPEVAEAPKPQEPLKVPEAPRVLKPSWKRD